MEILCNKNEFANLILDCRESECTKCALEIHCEKGAKKSGDVTKPEGLISICKITEDCSGLVRANNSIFLKRPLTDEETEILLADQKINRIVANHTKE